MHCHYFHTLSLCSTGILKFSVWKLQNPFLLPKLHPTPGFPKLSPPPIKYKTKHWLIKFGDDIILALWRLLKLAALFYSTHRAGETKLNTI